VQKVVDPFGRDITAEYANKNHDKFLNVLRGIYSNIAMAAFENIIVNKKKTNSDSSAFQTQYISQFLEPAKISLHDYFQSMKGGINIDESNLEEAIRFELIRQWIFFDALRSLQARFNTHSNDLKQFIEMTIKSPRNLQCTCNWDTGIIPQVNLKIGSSSFLCAFAPTNAASSYYAAPVQGPLPGVILYLDQYCVIVKPYEEELPEIVWKLIHKTFGNIINVRDQFPNVVRADLGPNFLFIDPIEPLSTQELENAWANYHLKGIIHASGKLAQTYLWRSQTDSAIPQEPRMFRFL
jgi:hypothetical protein